MGAIFKMPLQIRMWYTCDVILKKFMKKFIICKRKGIWNPFSLKRSTLYVVIIALSGHAYDF